MENIALFTVVFDDPFNNNEKSTEHGLIEATNYSDAARKIEKAYENIIDIKISIYPTPIFYFKSEFYDTIKQALDEIV